MAFGPRKSTFWIVDAARTWVLASSGCARGYVMHCCYRSSAKSMLISAKYRQSPQTKNAMNRHHAKPNATASLNAPVRFLRLFAGIIMDAGRPCLNGYAITTSSGW
ncbi:hypothetical protein [Achromobacter kerstersii]